MIWEISHKLGLLSNKEDDIIDKLREMNLVIHLYHCGNLLKDQK